MLYVTPIGPHDGDSWERLCQACLKIRYRGNYIEVPADPGDYGLDGFTLEGEAFQCYCPEKEHSDDDLYASQRDKITRDINKLKKYEAELTELLNGVKLKRWYFLTPKIKSNDLIFHCNNKVDLVKGWNLPFIEIENFKVVPIDYQYLGKELPSALSLLDYAINPTEITPRLDFEILDVTDDQIEAYKLDIQTIDQANKAFRKHRARYPNDEKDYTVKVVKQVDRTIKNLFIGDSILKEWETLFQDQLDRFLKIMSTLERKVEDLCDSPFVDNEQMYVKIQLLVEETIESEFPKLSASTKMNLSMRVVSDWILRCPLNLE